MFGGGGSTNEDYIEFCISFHSSHCKLFNKFSFAHIVDIFHNFLTHFHQKQNVWSLLLKEVGHRFPYLTKKKIFLFSI